MNVRRVYLILLLLLCVFIWSCKKHTVESSPESSAQKEKMEIDKDPNAYNEKCVSCTLSIEEKGTLIKQVLIKVMFRNEADFPVPIEKRNLFVSIGNKPGEMDYSTFEVSRDGEEIEYQGKVIKRRTDAAEFPEDYYVLPPNGEYVTTVNLSKYYNLRKSGLYSIKYQAWNYLTYFFKKSYAFKIESDVVEFEK